MENKIIELGRQAVWVLALSVVSALSNTCSNTIESKGQLFSGTINSNGLIPTRVTNSSFLPVNLVNPSWILNLDDSSWYYGMPGTPAVWSRVHPFTFSYTAGYGMLRSSTYQFRNDTTVMAAWTQVTPMMSAMQSDINSRALSTDVYTKTASDNRFFIKSDTVPSGTVMTKTAADAALSTLVPNSRNLTIAGTSFDLSADRTWSPTTTNIPEGTNLYYTASRFNTAFSGKSTTDLLEGANLYFTNSRSRSAISLTTTGSGAATYNSSTGVLNVPTGGSGTVTSVGITSSDFSVSGSPVTGSGNITANLNTSGITAGTYRAAVTYNNKGIATSAINPTINNAVSHSLSNAAGSTNRFTISTTQPAFVTYSITMNFTITALLSSSATVYLEYSTDAGSSWQLVSQCTTSFGLGLALTGSNDMSLSGYLPANALVRLRPATTNATAAYITGQEVLY